jgi:ankyrin repeat protein
VPLLLACALLSGTAHGGAYEDILNAAEQNHTDEVLGLIGRGLDVNTASPDGTTLLMTAARNGNLRLFDALLRMRANHLIRNKYGDTALMFAALHGRLDAVKRLADLGGPQENRDGWTPLHYAAFGGHVEVARYLMEKGAKVDAAAPNGHSALMLAAGSGHLEMVKLLADAEAAAGLGDGSIPEARRLAAAKGHPEVADYLGQFERPQK